MGKSSSSVKRKRSRVSSLARTKKRSKSRLRKSNKSKKLHPRDDSVSYSSDSDGSRCLVSVSSSSSEDSYRSKRSRSRMGKDGKGRRKRARRRSSSRESAEEFRPVKKRKRSKKADDLQVRKKSDKKKKKKKKKKSKREVSVSSASSRSLSCSTCQGGRGSSSESEVEKNGSKFDRKDKDRRRLEKVRSGSKQRRSRSRSWSSYSRSESSGYRSEENLTCEVNPRRLKSVITVLREGRDDRDMDEYEHKEEMVYDYDECPPCRSNDSNDGVSKRDLVRNLCVASEKKRYAEDEKREKPFNSNMGTGNVSGSDKDSEGQYDRSNSGCYGIGMNDAVKVTSNEDSGGVDSPSSYDLESILRQKALENLKTFRKGTQLDAKVPVNQKDTNECDSKTPTISKAEFNQHKSPIGGDPRVIGASPVVEKSTTPAVSKGSIDFEHKISGINDVCKGSGFTKDDAVHAPGQVTLASNPNKNVSATVRSVSCKSRLVSLSSTQGSSNSWTNKKHVSELQEPPQAKALITNSMVETARTAISLSGNGNGEDANNASASDEPSTCPKSLPGGVSSNKQQDEGTEDSQFQQKTMSVMRGGEMVEVSYKVYIPKKAPALARRPLRR